MAAPTTSTGVSADVGSSYDTALCIIPPKHLWPELDHLRMIHDPAYRKWPPHINLVYPFFPVNNLRDASGLIISLLVQRYLDHPSPPDIQLDGTGTFTKDAKDTKERKTTYFLCGKSPLLFTTLRSLLPSSLERNHNNDDQLRMILGQTDDLTHPLHKFAVQILNSFPTLQWRVEKIYILVRDKDETRIDPSVPSQMKIWGEIDLQTYTLLTMQNPIGFYEDEKTTSPESNEQSTRLECRPLTRLPYIFSHAEFKWIQQQKYPAAEKASPNPESLVVANYNVHAEFQYPPTRARYPIIIQNLLDARALADVLVLEEITDDFLSYLCKDKRVRETYPFISNGPPDQSDIGPLPSRINIVVLSKWPFSWDLLSLSASCKGSVIMQFTNIGKHEGGVFIPAILSAVHLSSGLTDASVQRKGQELWSLFHYLAREYPRNPWILAGDFNIPTSVYTIETAVKRNEISSGSRNIFTTIEKLFIKMGLVDAWASACVQYGDLPEQDLRQPDFKKALGGEKAATFDPIANHLAESTARSDFDKRPQRYDRILVKREDFTVTGFNMFGQRMGASQTDFCVDSKDDGSNVQLSYGSDHWGIKCSLKISKDGPVRSTDSSNTAFTPLKTKQEQMAASQLAAYLSEQSVFPSDVDIAMRESALCLLKEVMMQDEDNLARGLPAFMLVPVGSYGLGVWTAASDINCLCIGRISSKTFLALAIQRLRKAAWRGIKILRRVDAHSGTSLGLAIGHIKIDLQYCSAVSIAETWPAALALPPTDPVFKLPQSALATLKPVRDLHHLLGTIPDLAAFRLSYHVIKCWAKRRGIYAAQFGYLSGIQISILLSRVCKLLADTRGPVSGIQMILRNFYHHYAGFDWDDSVVFDPFFHKELSYVRTEREPMVILGFHGPRLNTAQTMLVSTAHTIIKELKRADSILSGTEMVWTELLNENTGITEFLRIYMTYIKVTARFWGVSLARINTTLEWLESKCALLLVEIGKAVPDIYPRIWPSRFVNQEASEEDEEYEGHYLIGLELKDPTGLPTDITRIRSMQASLDACIRIFEAQASRDAKYFDPKSSWISATITLQRELGELRLDNRDWGKYVVEAEDEDIGDSEFWASMEADEARESPTKKETRLSQKPTYEGKLRSAGDVLNRLRWDQAIDSSDYIIGYEDRFSGAMERSVDSWKSDTTHEEFIPEHRILYFKRKSDGTMVWDREERRDEIFGSGVSSVGR
ncbi:hypothetical protein F4813DRAFT_363121 [Daldinia decipiens]|uniref:uncharacterized protein n=1 Tax=Daldinia decipiens TaxID=326647 RepID=UPI0020C35DD3|nr:uncharacterized protein F4813DRAFT_363121 [Daldinia decipiens]KAI1656741.1 hypothetical protein F4813DRAFT_363121 [Daldinia decipiens]